MVERRVIDVSLRIILRIGRIKAVLFISYVQQASLQILRGAASVNSYVGKRILIQGSNEFSGKCRSIYAGCVIRQPNFRFCPGRIAAVQVINLFAFFKGDNQLLRVISLFGRGRQRDALRFYLFIKFAINGFYKNPS